eukprot:gene26932-35631_t
MSCRGETDLVGVTVGLLFVLRLPPPGYGVVVETNNRVSILYEEGLLVGFLEPVGKKLAGLAADLVGKLLGFVEIEDGDLEGNELIMKRVGIGEGTMVFLVVGTNDGDFDESNDGFVEGTMVFVVVGTNDGAFDESKDGNAEGVILFVVGTDDGNFDESKDGFVEGTMLFLVVGTNDGAFDESKDGFVEGTMLFLVVGLADGALDEIKFKEPWYLATNEEADGS